VLIYLGANVLISSLNLNDPVSIKLADFGTSQSVAVPITINKGDNPIWQGVKKQNFLNFFFLKFKAPEILNNDPYDERVDTYAMGIVFWEMVARKVF
jgi:serine/threonine protein kinase